MADAQLLPEMTQPLDIRGLDTTRAAVAEIVVDILGVEATAVSARSDLLTLGADSLHFVAIVTRIEERFNIDLPAAYAVPGRCTIAELADAVVRVSR